MPALLKSTSMRPKRSTAAVDAGRRPRRRRARRRATVRHARPSASTSARSESSSSVDAHRVAGIRERRGDVERDDVVAVAASASAVARPWPWAAPVMNATGGSCARTALQVVVERDLQRVVEDVGGDHDRPEGDQRRRSASSSKRSAQRACSASSTRVRVAARAGGRGRRSARRSRRAASASGSSPASISSRRKNVEQIRQSLCVEIAWQNSHVRRSPRNADDLVVQRIPLQQRVAAPRASARASTSCSSCARRSPAWAAASSCEPVGADASSTGGMRAIPRSYGVAD